MDSKMDIICTLTFHRYLETYFGCGGKYYIYFDLIRKLWFPGHQIGKVSE